MTTHCFADECRWPLLWNPVNRYSRQQLAKLSFFFSCQINTKAIVSKPDSTLSHEPYSIHFGSGQCRVGCCVLVRVTPWRLLYRSDHRVANFLSSTTSMAGTLQVVQVTSFLLRPFSEKLLVRINSRLVGTMWTAMQVRNLFVWDMLSMTNMLSLCSIYLK